MIPKVYGNLQDSITMNFELTGYDTDCIGNQRRDPARKNERSREVRRERHQCQEGRRGERRAASERLQGFRERA